jgi:hypothetical protein
MNTDKAFKENEKVISRPTLLMFVEEHSKFLKTGNRLKIILHCVSENLGEIIEIRSG